RERVMRYAYAARCNRDEEGSDGELAQAMFWLATRLRKGAGLLGVSEFLEWVQALHIVAMHDVQPATCARLISDLRARWPAGLRRLPLPAENGSEDWLERAEAVVHATLHSRYGRSRLRAGIVAADLLRIWRTEAGSQRIESM